MCTSTAGLRRSVTFTRPPSAMSSLSFGFAAVKNGAAEVDGVPEEAISAFSSRRAAGGGQPGGKRLLFGPGHPGPKVAVPNLPELRHRWLDQAAALGTSGSFSDRPTAPDDELTLHVGELQGRLISPEGLTAHSSSFDRRAVLEALAEPTRAEPAP